MTAISVHNPVHNFTPAALFDCLVIVKFPQIVCLISIISHTFINELFFIKDTKSNKITMWYELKL